jgi:hypothetical protein
MTSRGSSIIVGVSIFQAGPNRSAASAAPFLTAWSLGSRVISLVFIIATALVVGVLIFWPAVIFLRGLRWLPANVPIPSGGQPRAKIAPPKLASRINSETCKK